MEKKKVLETVSIMIDSIGEVEGSIFLHKGCVVIRYKSGLKMALRLENYAPNRTTLDKQQ